MAGAAVAVGPDDSTPQSQVCTLSGVHLLGSGRLRLCQTLVDELRHGDWVEIASSYGVEGGLVTAPPEQLLGRLSAEPYGTINRCLDATEIERVAELADEARALLIELTSAAEMPRVGWLITGLRISLRPGQAIVSWRGDTSDEAVAGWLRHHLDRPYSLEREGADGSAERVYGGLGRLRPVATDMDEIIRHRFDPAGSSDRPGGFPRLLSRVSTQQGEGVVISISTKHREARVKLAGGGEIQVPLNELQVLGWNR